jgi:nucleoside phosphorylase
VSLWALIGVVSAAIAADWGVFVILLCTVLLSGMAGGLVLRANRRVPETKG